LKEVKNVESFLITITRNKCFDLLRKIKLELKMFETRSADFQTVDSEAEERIILNETRKIVQEAIDALPSQQRQVYQLCYRDELKYEEAAKALGLSVFTVQSYMKLALKSIRKRLGNRPDLAVLLIVIRLL
jgi:RNA polymerase sigma factor (sigma-70 family)